MRQGREALYTVPMLLVLQPVVALSQPTTPLPNFFELIATFAPALLTWGWLFVLFYTLWLVWHLYKFIMLLDYIGSIKFTVLQVTLPDTAEQTPKAMENAVALWGGIQKTPDLYEELFEGYIEAFYSLEVQCTSDRVRYFMVIPEVHRQFFEGVVYGQYPEAQIREAPDYALRFDPLRVRQDFEVYGTDMIFVKSDVYPIRTYTQYDDPLAPNDRFIDPHQALVEAYSNVNPGEEFWFQVIVWPTRPERTAKWVAQGEKEIARITGRGQEAGPGLWGRIRSFLTVLTRDAFQVALGGRPAGGGAIPTKGSDIHFFDPVETAQMEGILHKSSREAYPTCVRVIHIAPKGKLHKPNIGRAIGGFKQFNTFHLNSFKPNPVTKSNGVDYIMKERRRAFRERQILAFFRWRDPSSGVKMVTAEEIATLYHFPTRWVTAPVLERAKAGTYSAPDNLPYV